MSSIKKIACLFYLLVFSTVVLAQDGKTTMADTMRSNGKIYVVVAVVLTILIGLILYVIRIERKIRKLERNQ